MALPMSQLTDARGNSLLRNVMGPNVMGPRGQPVPMYGYVRHGSDERASFRGARSATRWRSRENRDIDGHEPPVHRGPAGPQERQEWSELLSDISTRVRTLEST